MNKLDQTLAFNQNVLRVRGQRQELLASNVANADTPNYKARDIDFKAAMKGAMSGTGAEPFNTTLTSPMHLAGVPSTVLTGAPGEPLYRQLIQGSVDGNSVDMDVERNQFADNAIRYESSLISINGQLKQIMTAINGQ